MSQQHSGAADRAEYRLRLASAYERVFASPEGAMVLEDLARMSHFFEGLYAGQNMGLDGMALALNHAYRQGRRSLFLHIMRQRGMPVSQLMKDLEEALQHGPDPAQAVRDLP